MNIKSIMGSQIECSKCSTFPDCIFQFLPFARADRSVCFRLCNCFLVVYVIWRTWTILCICELWLLPTGVHWSSLKFIWCIDVFAQPLWWSIRYLCYICPIQSWINRCNYVVIHSPVYWCFCTAVVVIHSLSMLNAQSSLELTGGIVFEY